MSNDEKIEFSTRGKRQLKAILHSEIKEQIDELIEPMIKNILNNRINAKLSDNLNNRQIERWVKERIDGNYWQMYNTMLTKADFQETLTNEIIKYLHDRWACGITPFEEQFDKALMKAVKKLIKK